MKILSRTKKTYLILKDIKPKNLESLMSSALELSLEISINEVSGDRYEIKLGGEDKDVRKFAANVMREAVPYSSLRLFRSLSEELNVKFKNPPDQYVASDESAVASDESAVASDESAVASDESAQVFFNIRPDNFFFAIFTYLLILGTGFLFFEWFTVADNLIRFSFFFFLTGMTYRIMINRNVDEKALSNEKVPMKN